MKSVMAEQPLCVEARGLGHLLSLSRATIFQLHSAGKLPLPVRFGARGVRWYVLEIQQWIEAGQPDREQWERAKASAKQRGDARGSRFRRVS